MPGSGGQDPRFIRRANPFVVTDPADGAGDIDADAAQLLSQILDVVLGESEKRGTIPEVSGLVRTEGAAALSGGSASESKHQRGEAERANESAEGRPGRRGAAKGCVQNCELRLQ